MIPKELCHYTKRDTALEKILYKKEIKIGQSGFTNDPRESQGYYFGAHFQSIDVPEGGVHMKEIYDRAFIIQKEEWKILCMTKHDSERKLRKARWENKFRFGYCRPRMWAQYAENHSGVCLIFDGKKLHDNIISRLRETSSIFHGSVVYISHRNHKRKGELMEVKDYYDSGDNGIRKHYFSHYKLYFLTKYMDWQGESEYRWMIHNTKNSHEYINIERALISVLVGLEFPKVYEPTLRELCKELNVPAGKMEWFNGTPTANFGSIYSP